MLRIKLLKLITRYSRLTRCITPVPGGMTVTFLNAELTHLRNRNRSLFRSISVLRFCCKIPDQCEIRWWKGPCMGKNKCASHSLNSTLFFVYSSFNDKKISKLYRGIEYSVSIELNKEQIAVIYFFFFFSVMTLKAS